jgi:hypothetical protein
MLRPLYWLAFHLLTRLAIRHQALPRRRARAGCGDSPGGAPMAGEESEAEGQAGRAMGVTDGGEPREGGQGFLERGARALLAEIGLFSRAVLERPLREYQHRPLKAILRSVMGDEGREFLLIFPRQAGKNEAVAQLLVYLLNLYKREGGQIVYGTIGDGLGLGMARLEARLENAWNEGCWTRGARPARRCLGKACVVFLSTHPQAFVRGQTAHRLLVIDEAQDQVGSHIEAVFTPMRASTNATAVYLGTVRSSHDYLWRKKEELEREEARDGVRRVYLVRPAEVTAENPAYGTFLAAQVRRYGRHHPIVASEYFLEPVDAGGGLFDARRLALLRGTHARRRQPTPGALVVATLDVAGQDEATTDALARLENPARDYTVCTVWEVAYPAPAEGGVRWSPGPTYRAVDVFVDHGSRHFEDVPGRPALVKRVAAYLEAWGLAHLVTDASGVGEGVTSWLTQALGAGRVTGFSFAGPGKKAWLGSAFLSLVETGRVSYWSDDAEAAGSDGWWFWRQCEACQYTVPPGGQIERDLRWGVPAGATLEVPGQGRQPVHDDRLLSAALIAEVDRLLRTGALRAGTTESAVIEAADPLEGLGWGA